MDGLGGTENVRVFCRPGPADSFAQDLAALAEQRGRDDNGSNVLPALLAKNGLAAVEIGSDQGETVPEILARDGLVATVAPDLAGRPRAVLLTWID